MKEQCYTYFYLLAKIGWSCYRIWGTHDIIFSNKLILYKLKNDEISENLAIL